MGGISGHYCLFIGQMAKRPKTRRYLSEFSSFPCEQCPVWGCPELWPRKVWMNWHPCSKAQTSVQIWPAGSSTLVFGRMTHTHNLTSPDADMCTINRPRSNQASQESSGSSGLSAGSFRDRMTMRRRSCTSLPAGSLLQDCGHAMWKFCVRLVMSCSKSIAIRQWFRMMCIEAEEPIRIRKDLRPYWLWKLRDCIFVGTRTLVLKVLES